MLARTYDIINAGPNNRFLANGRIVSNSGRTFQPQNLPSRNLVPSDQIEPGIELLKQGKAGLIYDNVMLLTSSTIRGTIIPASGMKLVVSDLSNIEGRDAAWLAGENWKLQAYRDFDAGTGEDLYNMAYAKAFKIDAKNVDKKQRLIGKTMELALGYEGGVGAFMTFAAAFDIDLEELVGLAWDTLPLEQKKEAEGFHDWFIKKGRSTFGLSREAFVVCDTFKRVWRESNSNIVNTWHEMEANVIRAINNPSTTFECRRFKIRRDGNWLRVQLPSGRALCYPSPQVDDKDHLSYMGVHQYTRKWQRIGTHGGKLFENACQSLARDVMYDAMPAIEKAGYAIVLTVHDEVVCEAPNDENFSADELSKILSTNPVWAPGMPLAAAGFEANRYKKG